MDGTLTFGERLKMVLVTQGISYEQLAKKLSVSRNCIYHWCVGDRLPNVDTLRKICVVLNVNANWLIGVGGRPYV